MGRPPAENGKNLIETTETTGITAVETTVVVDDMAIIETIIMTTARPRIMTEEIIGIRNGGIVEEHLKASMVIETGMILVVMNPLVANEDLTIVTGITTSVRTRLALKLAFILRH